MEIQQLKYFLGVVKYKHFTTAAEELCISQSSLSKNIKSLEDELKVKLLDRSTRNVKLTEAGMEFFNYARQIVDTYSQMQTKMNEYRDKNKNSIKIGTIPVMSQYGITSLLASFIKQNKDIDIHIIEGRSPEILSLLDTSQIDAAFIRTISLPDNNYKISPLIEDELVMIVSKGHSFAESSCLNLSQASEENFIFLDSGRGIYDLCMEACKNSGFEPHVLHKNSRIETIIGLVSEGVGISLLMKRVVEFFNNKDIAIVELSERFVTTLALVRSPHKKSSEAVKKFSLYTEEWFKQSR
ncbi:LysR family transcriptional regulator [Clostridium sp. SYSU_GA19001]|uniref:LysR family transcriptional regulator n=1 Tax=Clostridium caldaquaticum TaxID=2940653 RepID=UPI0020778BC2|nr:LysR family transcriptional regulator [Clostridium caldaquaticum]MCM8710317.1 LysR family transcriptional regulator [Clostridium caldaquaticum]